LNTKRVDYRTCWLQNVLDYRTCWLKKVLTTVRVDYRTCWLQNVLTTERVDYSTCWLQNVFNKESVDYRKCWLQNVLTKESFDSRTCWLQNGPEFHVNVSSYPCTHTTHMSTAVCLTAADTPYSCLSARTNTLSTLTATYRTVCMN